MSVTGVLGHSSDGYLESASTSYAAAVSGTNVVAPGNSSSLMYHGQSLGAGVRYVWQSFIRFTWTADAESTPVAAVLALQPGSTAGGGVSRDLEVRAYSWGTSVTTGNWRTPGQLLAAPLRGRVIDANRAGGAQMRPGIDPTSIPATSGQLHYVLTSSRNRLQQAPTSLEWQTLRQSETSNSTAQRPALYVGTVRKHLLDLSLGAQVQLSDGTHMLLVQTSVAGQPVGLDLVHHNGETATTVFTGEVVEGRVGAQAYTMCRDDADNVFVLNRSGVLNRMNARAFTRTRTGAGWSAGPTVPCPLPAYDGHINQVAAAWHPQGGTAGTIVAVAACEAGTNTGAQATYALVNVDHLLGGGGSALRGSGSAIGTVIAAQATPGFSNPTNETGTLLDVTAVRDANGDVSDRGYVLSAGQHQTLGARHAQSTARYQLNAAGTAITTARVVHTTSGFSVKDPDARSRVLPVSRTQFVTVTASDSTAFGIVVKHHQQGSGSSFDVLADVRLAAQDVESMPAPGVVATSSVWDALYDPTTHAVWVYYLDADDSRRLLKTHVDLGTGLAAADAVVVAEDVGPRGSRNLAIRLHRGETAGQGILVSVANRTAEGAHALVLVSEQVNLPPEAPQLLPRPNFDAEEDTRFSWQFRDPNPADHQSGHHVQLWDDGTDTLVIDTDKTLSTDEFHDLVGGTLDNGGAFRWRVRTWDSHDEVSPWSRFGFVATSASGNVSITAPPVDNPASAETADVQIAWQVTGATADHYRVRVVRTADGGLHSDTDWIESTARTHLVQGLDSEVEYRIEVTSRALMVESSTGTRLITPDYSSPTTPVISVVGVDAGAHIRVEIDNPPPGADLSGPDGTFETGTTAGWVASPFLALEVTDAHAYGGQYAALLRVEGSPSRAGVRPEEDLRSEVVEHRRYTTSYWARADQETAGVRAAVDWYDQDQALIGTTEGEPVTVPAGEWTLITMSASAPPGAARAGYGPDILAPADGSEVVVDGLEMRSATDIPIPIVNEVWRSANGAPLTLIGRVDPGDSFTDYLVGSGRDYSYTARAVAPAGASTTSTSATGQTYFLGVWIHDPNAPEETIRQYLYGRAQRSHSIAAVQELHHFVGRTHPVAAYGEHQTDTWQITIDLPDGPDRLPSADQLEAWSMSRRTLAVRDNRGRVWLSALDGFAITDQEWGDQASFVATRVSSNLPGGVR